MEHATEAPEAKEHLAYLDGLRALAALAVVASHATTCIPKAAASSRPLAVAAHLFAHGQFAVCVFIVLSGFCLMLPVARGDGCLRGGAWGFFRRRARRILPPYYCAFGLSLLLVALCLNHRTGTFWDYALPVTTLGVAAHLLLLQDVLPTTGLQGDYPLWSISVEWRIYFAFPLLVLLWQRVGPLAATALAVAAGYLILLPLTVTPVNTGLYGVSPHFLGLFALGILGAGIASSGQSCLPALRRAVPWSWVGLALTVLVPLALRQLEQRGEGDSAWSVGTLVGVWAAVLLVAVSVNPGGWLRRILSWHPLAFLGTFAYSIYLVHAPLLTLLWWYVLAPLRLRGVTAALAQMLMVVAVVALCYGFYFLCERPFLSHPVVLNAGQPPEPQGPSAAVRKA